METLEYPRPVRLEPVDRPAVIAVIAAIGIALLLGSAAASASAPTTVVLGRKNLLRYGQGWGTPHPRVIFNGGDPSGRAWNLRWRGWGKPVATAEGLTWIFRPTGGYYARPAAIELRASRIARCVTDGPHAYTRLEAREAVRPSGPFGRWFAWGGWKSICIGP